MKQSTAVAHLREMAVGIQKLRDTIQEDSPDLSPSQLETFYPWIFGEKCPLPPLLKLLNNVETPIVLKPMNYLNFMTLLYRSLYIVVVGSISLPNDPIDSSEYLQGWTPE